MPKPVVSLPPDAGPRSNSRTFCLSPRPTSARRSTGRSISTSSASNATMTAAGWSASESSSVSSPPPPTTAVRAIFRCCAASWRRRWRAPNSRPPATTARLCSTSSKPIRATNCFRCPADHLYQTCIGILNLQERQRVAAFFRGDDFGRFMSVLIYIPRDRYTYVLRQRMRAILERTLLRRNELFQSRVRRLAPGSLAHAAAHPCRRHSRPTIPTRSRPN